MKTFSAWYSCVIIRSGKAGIAGLKTSVVGGPVTGTGAVPLKYSLGPKAGFICPPKANPQYYH